jgi:hypothetical protein
MCEAKPATATELAQLSSLTSFTDLRLSTIYTSQHHTRAVALWHCLPLRSLSLGSVELSPEFLQQLTALQGLTYLSLESFDGDEDDENFNTVAYKISSVTTAQVAAAVQQLTALQHLWLTNTRRWCESGLPIRGVVALLRAVGSLEHLSDVHVRWHFGQQISAAEAQQVSRVLQLLPRSLVPRCKVRDGLVMISH